MIFSNRDLLKARAMGVVAGSGGSGDAGGSGGIIVENKVWSDSTTVTGGVSNSLVGNGVIRYVTFMSYDGTVEYGRKSVIAGENCLDPVSAGLMATPTRESTAQYNYTFSGGWATTPNGGKDSNALKNVTEDRTVYANFISAVRYYTVTYYDSDGATVLKTESLAYGATPSYTPKKQGYLLNGWVPSFTTVSGDMSYTAQWEAAAAFEAATWDEINNVINKGLASEVYSIGDEKTVTLTHEDGTTEDFTFVISDFGASEVADYFGTGNYTNSIGLIAKYAFPEKRRLHSSNSTYNFTSTELSTYLNSTFLNALPQTLKIMVKPKYVYGTSKVRVWIPSILELQLVPGSDVILASNVNNPFPLFDDYRNRKRTLGPDGEETYYWLRDYKKNSAGYANFSTGHGENVTTHGGQTPTNTSGVVVGICL